MLAAVSENSPKSLVLSIKTSIMDYSHKNIPPPAKSGACYLQRAYKSHLAASGYGISHTHTHPALSLFSSTSLPSVTVLLLFCPSLLSHVQNRASGRDGRAAE